MAHFIESRARAGRQHTLVCIVHHFLQKAVFHEAFAMDAAQVVGPEHTPAAPLKFLENVEGFSQFFVRSGHRASSLFGSLQVYRAVRTQVYYVAPLQVNDAVPIQVYCAFN